MEVIYKKDIYQQIIDRKIEALENNKNIDKIVLTIEEWNSIHEWFNSRHSYIMYPQNKDKDEFFVEGIRVEKEKGSGLKTCKIFLFIYDTHAEAWEDFKKEKASYTHGHDSYGEASNMTATYFDLGIQKRFVHVSSWDDVSRLKGLMVDNILFKTRHLTTDKGASIITQCQRWN